MFRIIGLIILALLLTSCGRPPIHDLKSPCVAAEQSDPSNSVQPCIRRPVNLNRDIT